MKRLLLALPLVAGASWAGTTYYSGAQTQPAYELLLEQMNNSPLLVFESKNYDPGFMSSTALTEVKFKGDNATDVLFTLQHKINHSPVSMVPETARFAAANIVTTLAMDTIEDDETRAALESFNTGEPFVLTTEVTAKGTTTSELKINSREHTEDDTTIKSSEAIITFLTTENGSIKGDGVLPDLLITDDSTQQGQLSNLSLNFSMDKTGDDTDIPTYFYDIVFSINAEEAKVVDTETEESLLIVKDAYYALEQKLTADDPYANVELGVKSIDGDVSPIRSANIKSELSGFSMKEMMANADFYTQMKDSSNPEQLLFSGKGLQIMRDTFRPGTKLSVTGNAEAIDGDIDAKINLWFTGNGSDDGYTGMVTTGDLAKAFAATANITADKAPLMATPLGEMLQNPLALMYLSITDDQVSLNANLDKLTLEVNGQMLPLELMGGEMLQMPLEMLLSM